MSCCGGRRAAFHPRVVSATRSGNVSYRPPETIEFEYTGHGQLTVKGPATGVTYRFETHGYRLPVHGADAASLRNIPSLKPSR
jgi:hypothetical protein